MYAAWCFWQENLGVPKTNAPKYPLAQNALSVTAVTIKVIFLAAGLQPPQNGAGGGIQAERVDAGAGLEGGSYDS